MKAFALLLIMATLPACCFSSDQEIEEKYYQLWNKE